MSGLVITVGGGRGIDGRQLVIDGLHRQYFNWVGTDVCAGCGHPHTSHFQDSETYRATSGLLEALRRDLQIMFDRCRVLRTGCDECTCAGLTL